MNDFQNINVSIVNNSHISCPFRKCFDCFVGIEKMSVASAKKMAPAIDWTFSPIHSILFGTYLRMEKMKPLYKTRMLILLLIILSYPFNLPASENSQGGFVGNISTTISKDYRNFYSLNNLKYILGGVCVAGILANTKADGNFQDWFQESIRDDNTDQFSKVAKPIGNIYEPISVYSALTVLGSLTKHTAPGAIAHELGSKSLRAIIVGAPVVGALQYALGASRPTEGGSEWHPFRDTNSASGHAFMGAVPFLTISQIVKPKFLKALFYAGSLATGFSRINDNKHYLSQVMLGWWIAYLSTKSVDISKKKRIAIEPGYSYGGWKIMLNFSL